MNILFTTKVKMFMPIKLSYRFPLPLQLSGPLSLGCYHILSTQSNLFEGRDFFGIFSWSHTKPRPTQIYVL
jgi:hypothetical protein